jgi:UDP-glucose 4-epimerase
MSLKKYLVTGGAGFIGSAVASQLIKEGNTVCIIDNLSSGYRENIPSGAFFIQGNCEDELVIAQLESQFFDAIFHIAGQSSGEVSYDNPVLDMQSNVQSTLVLLNYAVKTGCKTFIYASSMSVYGDAKKLPVSETAPTFPKSFYAVGKLASEHYLRIYQTFGIKTISLRLFNVYGIGQNMKNLRQGMASIYLAQALQHNKIFVKGSIDRFRDFVYITDVVRAIIKSQSNDIPSGIYNVCNGNKTRVKDVLDLIIEKLNQNTKVEIIESTPGDQFGIYGELKKFEETFGFKNEVSFQTGMSKMIDWAQNKLNLT